MSIVQARIEDALYEALNDLIKVVNEHNSDPQDKLAKAAALQALALASIALYGTPAPREFYDGTG